MRKEDKRKLTLNRRYIVQNLIDLESVLDYLIAKQIFTPATRERIVYESRVPSDRIRHTLDFLIRRGPTAYVRFLEALLLSGNSHIAQQLDKDYCDSEECRQLIENETRLSVEASNDDHHEHVPHLPPHRAFHAHMSRAATQHGHFQQYTQTPPHVARQARPQSLIHHAASLPTTPLNHIVNVNPVTSPASASSVRMHQHTQLAAASSVASLRVRSLSPAHYTQVASCHVITSPPPATQLLTRGHTHSAIASSHHANVNGRRSRDYSIDDTINLMSHESVIPSAGLDSETNELNWDEINSLDLDFHVNTNDDDCTDEVNFMANHGNSNFDYFVTALSVTFQATDSLNSDSQATDSPIYRMENSPRGICLIINNERFHDHDKAEMLDLHRHGTNMDASRLKHLFEKLKFDVEFYCDLTESQIRERIRALVRECDCNEAVYDAVCVIILSHGSDGYIHGADYENTINTEKDVLSPFDDVLNGKPKLFIFQACRGDNFNKKGMPANGSVACVEDTISRFNKMSMKAETPSRSSPRLHQQQQQPSTSKSYPLFEQKPPTDTKCSIYNFIDGRPIRTNLPSRSDFFIWYSCVRGFVAHRDLDGSPFIKCLVAVFSRYAKDLELTEMIQKVNMLMKQYEMRNFKDPDSQSSYFMSPTTEYHLTKKLYFNP